MIKQRTNKLRYLRKVVLRGVLILFISFAAIFLLLKSVVYAQIEVINNIASWLSLERWLSWIMGGSFLGIFINSARKNYHLFKRWFDLLIAALNLTVFSPLFFILAFLIKIDSIGPVFFKQERVGEKGKLFKIWKFRTMRDNAELETGPVWAQEEDPRITRLGRFLRQSHLDELPQLINIFRGEMSLIGPRPERPELFEIITKHIPDFYQRLEIKPGVTGLAQVRYHYGASVKDAGRKLKYDSIYIKKMCWLLDFQIIIWTIGRVFTGEGAR